MKISTVHAGLFKLDGGAMFGVVPKTLWNKMNPADERNLCTWSMQSLLIETSYHKILVDTGIGNKQDDKFRSHFEPHGPYDLIHSVEELHYGVGQITDVFITHFHFDHVGGAVSWDADKNCVPTFPEATYWSNERHYNWALNPNPRERASFLKENFVPLKEAGVLNFLPEENGYQLYEDISIHYSHGHTDALMYLDIKYQDRHLIFASDLLPSHYHIGMPYVMAYDIRPLISIEEKEQLLRQALERKDVIYFQHDPQYECGTVKLDQRGRIVVDELGTLEDFFG